MKKVEGGVVTAYVGGTYEVQGPTITKYYTFGGQRVAMRKAGTLTYLHGDHLGSTSLATDAGGGFLSRVLYYPYGETRYTEGTLPTDYRFTGQQLESGFGLYDYHARYYDPFLARFISADTIVPEPFNPQSLNRFSYVLGNPVLLNDPSGHAATKCLVLGAGSSSSSSPSPLGALWIVKYRDTPAHPYLSTMTIDYSQWMDEHPGYSPENDAFLTRAEQDPEWASAHGIDQTDIDSLYRQYNFRKIVEAEDFWQQVANSGLAEAGPPLIFAVASGHLAMEAEKATTIALSYRVYDPRVLYPEDPGPYHNFPDSFDDLIFSQGTRKVVSESYTLYELEGSINGIQGTYQIGVIPMESGGELVTHRFFQPGQ